MARSLPRLAPILLLLMLVPACGGPSAPSPATSASPTAAPATTAPEPGTPASAAASGGFEFLGSEPAPGGETSVSENGGALLLLDLAVRLTVHFNQSLPDAKVEFELFGDNGRQCAFGLEDRPLAPGHVYPVSNAFWDWKTQDCGSFPVNTVMLKATLLTLRGPLPNGTLQRTDYVIQTFQVRYTIRRYPPPPQNPPEAPPVVSKLEWTAFGPTGGDGPIPGDGVELACTGSETDGAPVTVKIAYQWEGLGQVVHAQAFQAGASSSPSGARLHVGTVAPNTAPVPRATLECVVTNDRGQHAVKTMNIGPAR